MILKALKYIRYEGEPREWRITDKDEDINSFVDFGNINFFVGKNASGKSRSLTVIKEIGEFFAGKRDLQDALFHAESFDALFEDGEDVYEYLLTYKERRIVAESLRVNRHEILNREKRIIIDLDRNKQLPFPDDIASPFVYCLGQMNIPYFSNLALWGKLLRNYLFSNELEKRSFASDYRKLDMSPTDTNSTVYLGYTFYRGYEDFGEAYISEIKDCMHLVGYENITNIEMRESKKGFGLYIEEDGRYTISQMQMSQGLFRVLALFIRLVYYIMSKRSICILIDDVGEGLDFERSKAMVNTMAKKINDSNIQLFMTTNDRYVMNQIPLRYWSVIERKESKSIFHNYFNSKEIFDDFKYTGLNNFDFLTTDFYKKGFDDSKD